MKNLDITDNISINNKHFTKTITNDLKKLESLKSTLFFKNNEKTIHQIVLAANYVKTYFTIILEDENPVFLSYYQLINPNENTVKKIAESNQITALMGILLGISNLKVLVMGNMLRNNFENYIYHSSVILPENALKIWLEAGEQVAKKLKSTALVSKEMLPHENDTNLLAHEGFLQQFPDILMELQIDKSWKSINDYALALTRKYTARFNKIRENLPKIAIETLDLIGIEANKSVLQDLYLQTIEDQDFVFAEVNQQFWLKMKNIFQDNFQIHILIVEHKIVAFYTTIETEFELEMYYLGYDKSFNQKYSLYFNMLFLGLETAILKSKNILKLGRTSLDAKQNLGAQKVEKSYLIKLFSIKGKMLDAWLKCQWTDRTIKTLDRNPFRKVI